MQITTRRLSLVLAVALLALVAVACAQPAGQPAAQETVVVEKQVTAPPTTQLVYNSYQSDPEPRRVDQELVERFEEENPNIDITHSIVAHEDFKQAIRAYLTSSSPPDVLTWFAGNRMRFFVNKGQIMDISDVWEEEGWNETYPKGLRALSTVDGSQYFLPAEYYWWAVYYNTEIFEEYGLEPPETWDEFLEVCATLKENGVTPLTIGTKFRWTAAAWFDYLNMRINGPEFHISLMEGNESYDDPRVKEVFETWKVLLDNGYFIDNAASYAWQEAIPFLLQGDAAMYLMGQFIMDSIPEDQQDKFDFFRFPIIDENVPIGEDAPTDGFMIAKNAPHPEAAKEFLAYLGSAEVQTYRTKELGRVPANPNVDPSVLSDEVKKGMELIQGADFVAQFYDRDTTPPMADRGMNAFMDFWSNPDNIDSILAQLEKDRQQIFAEEQ